MRLAIRALVTGVVLLVASTPAIAALRVGGVALVTDMTGDGRIDTGEGVAMTLCVFNPDATPTEPLRGVLQAGGGIASPSGAQLFGSLAPGEGACRVFTFRVTATCGSVITPELRLAAEEGGSTPLTFWIPTSRVVATQNFDTVTPPALPGGWSSSLSGGTTGWRSDAGTLVGTPPNSVVAPSPVGISSATLESPTINVPNFASRLTFRHAFATEAGFDGGVLEIGINGGAYQDIVAAGGTFQANGYTGIISGIKGSALGGRQAWTGDSGGSQTVVVELPPGAIGQAVRFRWRYVTDTTVGGTGWRVDSIAVTASDCAAVPTDTPWGQTAEVHGNEVTLRWNPPFAGGSTTYTVEASADGGASFPFTFPIGAATSFTAVGPDGQFRTRVRATANGLTSPPTPSITVSVGAAFEPPRVRNLLAATVGDQVLLRWDASEPGGRVAAVQLDAGTAPGLADVATLALPPGTTSLAVGGVPPGTYHVRVRQLGFGVPGDPSANVVVDVGGACALPASPAFPTIARGAGGYAFTWSLGAVGTGAPASWRLEAGTAPGLANLGVVPLADRQFFAPTPPPGTYYVRLVAVNGCGASTKSSELTLVVP